MSTRKRMSADERRVAILDVAIREFGQAGMHVTSTERIAELAGVSQPYVFRLFGTKAELINAAIDRQADRVCETFVEAVTNRGPDQSALEAMATAYIELLESDVANLRFQLHAWSAASDSALHEASRDSYRRVWDTVVEQSGAGADDVRQFMSGGMLLTVLGSLDLVDLIGDPRTIAKENF